MIALPGKRALLRFLTVLVAGCTVADDPYPARWEPLPSEAASDCSALMGTYADRGESGTERGEPSLTRELFGPASPWQKARTVALAQPSEDTLEVRVSVDGADDFIRRLSAKQNEFACRGGQLMVRNRRWVATDTMSGRETVHIEMYRVGDYLVARVDEEIVGAMFWVVPLTGESFRWHRFARLKA